MTEDALAALERAMTEAAAREDYEEAARLRNQLFVARAGGGGGGIGEPGSDADFAGIRRQQPGAMGIGSQHPRPERPAGWTPPRKPSPMTGGPRKPRGRGTDRDDPG